MTLNLMLTSRSSVYLSGDFRLTYVGGSHRDSLETQKLVPVIRFGWSALVSFAGIAVVPSQRLDVGDWISYELQNLSKDAEFDNLLERLLVANSWLSKVPLSVRRLSFSVVGFVGRKPIAAIISNYLGTDGQVFDPLLSELRVFKWKPKGPEVRVVGDMNSVLADERKHLRKLLIQSPYSSGIHSALAEINLSASQRSGTISAECVTGGMLPTGDAEVMPHGIDRSIEYFPGFVKRRMAASGIHGFEAKVDDEGNVLSPRWVGMTAKVQGIGKKAAVVVMDSVANVGRPIGEALPGSALFWKVAGENEPSTYTFNVQY